MLHDTKRLEAALAPLVGLPLWKSTRAADLRAFHFGGKRTQTNRAGQESEVGDFALHVQCAWRIRGPRGIVVASCDWSGSDADERIRAWHREPHEVQRITADEAGGFAMSFVDGFVLETFPDDSLEDSERWRILRPGDLSSHFVMSGGGVED